MKARIKFTKQGAMKFIGHLDMMRYFQKAIRRAGIPIKYSEGFSPHQVMSFAAPLGVGLTSVGEYFDIEVTGEPDCDWIKRSLNEQMAEGVEILSCTELAAAAPNAMSIVAAADYTVVCNIPSGDENGREFSRAFTDFCGREQIRILKKTKKSEKEIDIRPMIYLIKAEEDRIFMRLAAGSAGNLKPELVMEAFFQTVERPIPPAFIRIQREEVYANMGKEGELLLIPLERAGAKL